MNRIIGIAIALPIVFFISGCDGRYSVEKTEGGLYRIDKWTGETTWIIAGEANKVVMPKEKSALENQLSSIRIFNEKTIPVDNNYNFKVLLKTLWRDGQLHYRMECRPFSDRLEKIIVKPMANITFLLVDKYKFDLFEHTVFLNSARRIVNDNSVVEYFEFNGKVSMDQNLYTQVSDTRFGWSGLED